MNWLRFSKTILAAVAFGAGALVLGSHIPASAQTASDVDPLADFQTDDDGSDLFGSDGASSSSVFGLIHSLQLSNDANFSDFNERRSEDIQTEAESFRELQMQRIEAQETDLEIDLAE
ncbi:MAG: hypothetical protein AAFR31_08170 [Cyanobacteria bacterium J06627_8]